MSGFIESAFIWEEKVTIPTYSVGEPNKNPMFLEKRVYQGSSGKVYPYPVIDKIHDEKIDKEYNAVFLENKYLKIMILPSLGGRIQRAYDKTNSYDFVYHNEVIKPALVGLLGPWISGGIEFNWPQHHRPTTFMQCDYELKKNADGSVSLLIGDVDQMYGTQVLTTFTIHPDKAYIQIDANLYNRTSLPQTFLWWANPAVEVNDYTQSIFPPDVNTVFDHGKRAVSKFPIATGVYYKHDYSEGVDISKYKNIPVPTSYMAGKSSFDFIGGYDYKQEAGIIHIADHHISPGKKQWTWGCGDFGQAWDRNLTDKNGPYIELMTGVYTDNQPDFTWLMPFEEKFFTQYFMPYKKVGYCKNANIDLVVNFMTDESTCTVIVYPTHFINNAKIILSHTDNIIYEKVTDLTVEEGFYNTIPCTLKEHELVLTVYSVENKCLIKAAGRKKEIEKIPNPAEPAKEPHEIITNEELLLTAQQLEQYRHATYLPDPYYIEGLKRDPLDSRINTAYGLLLLRRGLFKEAEGYFRAAIKRITWRTGNPYSSESIYYLALSLLYQNKIEEAYDNFYKATWNESECEKSWYYLAAIATRLKNYKMALEYVQKALIHNSHNVKANALCVYIYDKLGKENEAITKAKANIGFNSFDWASRLFIAIKESKLSELPKLMHNRTCSFLYTAEDLILWGMNIEALTLLNLAKNNPMIFYLTAFIYAAMGDSNKEQEYLKKAMQANRDYCWPNSIEDLLILKYAIEKNAQDASAHYYLGCLLYDKMRYKEAYEHWITSYKIDQNFPTVQRNLSIVLYNKMNKKEDAYQFLEKAFNLDKNDARIFFELDQLREKLGFSPQQRLLEYEQNIDLIQKRDDLYCMYISLLNNVGQYRKALSKTMCHIFHPWEGGEGKITKEFITSHKMLAVEDIKRGEYENAKTHLIATISYPINLGEGKLEGNKDNDIHFLLANICNKLGDRKAEMDQLKLATLGTEEITSAMYYYDQRADMILYQALALLKLGDKKEAYKKCNKLIDYGEQHLFDDVKIDFFAVSLPDLQLWEDDLNIKNRAHCYFVMALGYLGLGEKEKAHENFNYALKLNPYLNEAKIHDSIMDFLLTL